PEITDAEPRECACPHYQPVWTSLNSLSSKDAQSDPNVCPPTVEAGRMGKPTARAWLGEPSGSAAPCFHVDLLNLRPSPTARHPHRVAPLAGSGADAAMTAVPGPLIIQ
ncbi:hypothetical protein, partial [Streptomyces sp. NPDC047000]|uniref:hypothetical protein n=1 Tax=Streptomyces sp. NPDC047000 TaxID=3155474 RepID=UPI0034114ABE